MYVYENKHWPKWNWDDTLVNAHLIKLVERQGRLLGKLAVLGFNSQEKTAFETGVLDVTRNSEIEGENLVEEQVRSSIAKNLGLDYSPYHAPKSDGTEGAVNMFLDATRGYRKILTKERLFDWHAGLFPTGRSSGRKIAVAQWRSSEDPMQIISGAMGREVVHYEAPSSSKVEGMMEKLLNYINGNEDIHPYIKAAIAHLWFEVIHPFEDGNGRVGRAIVDKILCEADRSDVRFYSFSNAVSEDYKNYYEQLNKASKQDLNIADWLVWFFNTLNKAIDKADEIINNVDFKRRFWEKFAQESFNDRQKKVISKLLDGFDGNITSSKWTRMTKCTKMTATRDINDLMAKSVLVKTEAGGRSTSYQLNTDF